MAKTTANRYLLAALCALGLSFASAPAMAGDFIPVSHPAFAAVSYQQTSIPVGAMEFCKSRPGECGPNNPVIDTVELTDQRWAELVAVNNHYNTTIQPMTDEQIYQVNELWTYPDNGYGDCEDFVLIKRRALMEAGWPASTLLVSVVRQQNGEGHAVLMVRTDRGDLVLDNQDSTIRVWTESPYHFLKRQSQANSGQWVDIQDERPIVIATAPAGNSAVSGF